MFCNWRKEKEMSQIICKTSWSVSFLQSITVHKWIVHFFVIPLFFTWFPTYLIFLLFFKYLFIIQSMEIGKQLSEKNFSFPSCQSNLTFSKFSKLRFLLEKLVEEREGRTHKVSKIESIFRLGVILFCSRSPLCSFSSKLPFSPPPPRSFHLRVTHGSFWTHILFCRWGQY